jgi:hypothetical protein
VALSHVTYLPDLDYHGGDALVVAVNDTGNHGVGGWSLDGATLPLQVLAANDAPIIHLPPQPQHALEDQELVLKGNDDCDDCDHHHHHSRPPPPLPSPPQASSSKTSIWTNPTRPAKVSRVRRLCLC